MPRALAASTAALLACAACHARPLITFDTLSAGDVVTNQFVSDGALFSGNWVVAGPGPSTNAVSLPNSVGFFNPASPLSNYTVRIDFVIPNTLIPGTTTFVAFTPTDASNFDSVFTMRAFDAGNNLIGIASRGVDSSGVYNPLVDTEEVIGALGISYVTLSVVSSGNNVIEGDNVRFGDVVPAPGALALAGIAACGAARRRRVHA